MELVKRELFGSGVFDSEVELGIYFCLPAVPVFAIIPVSFVVFLV
jgi:hypothetical protein